MINASQHVWAWWVASGSRVVHFDSRCANNRVTPYRRQYIRAYGLTIPQAASRWTICRSCPTKGNGPIIKAIQMLGELGLLI